MPGRSRQTLSWRAGAEPMRAGENENEGEGAAKWVTTTATGTTARLRGGRGSAAGGREGATCRKVSKRRPSARLSSLRSALAGALAVAPLGKQAEC